MVEIARRRAVFTCPDGNESGWGLQHVAPNAELCSMNLMILEMIKNLRGFRHYIHVATDDINKVNEQVIQNWQMYGDVTYGKIEDLAGSDLSIFYYMDGRYCHNSRVLYYDYNTLSVRRYNRILKSDPLFPAVNTRQFRRIKDKKEGPFTVALVSSFYEGRQPEWILDPLLSILKDTDRLVITYKDGGYDKKLLRRKNIWQVPCIIDATQKAFSLSDVIIYAHNKDYKTPLGRLFVEACASRIPVICHKSGYPATIDKPIALFFENEKELNEGICKLRNDPDFGEQLGANAHLWASSHDISIEIGTWKRLIKNVLTGYY